MRVFTHVWMPRAGGEVGHREMTQERNSERMVGQFAGIFVSHFGKEIVEVVQIRPPERVLGVPVPQVSKEIVDVARVTPQERARVAEHAVAVPGPLVLEEVFEAARLRGHVRISDRVCENIVEDPVPQVAEQFLAPCVGEPVPQNLNEALRCWGLTLCVQITENMFEHCGRPCPTSRGTQSLFAALPVPHNLTGICPGARVGPTP